MDWTQISVFLGFSAVIFIYIHGRFKKLEQKIDADIEKTREEHDVKKS